MHIDFMDITTYKGIDFQTTHTLNTKVYFKDTDYSLLHKTSLHPKHTFRRGDDSTEYSQKKQDFEEATRILFKALAKRNDYRSCLRNIKKCFPEQKQRDNRQMIPLISTYSGFKPAANLKIKQNFTEQLANTDLLTHYI